jgi:chloramphenicol O-acetyltransferase type B
MEWTKDIYPQFKIGRWTYGKPIVFSWNEGTTLEIGAFCSLALGARILLGGEHRTDWTTTYPFSELWVEGKGILGHPKTRGDVVIGNDVWVGMDSMILSGVKVGDGAVIGARAVVFRDVEPYTIVSGNPAVEIWQRFDDKTITEMLEIKWWNWNDKKIAEYLPLLLSKNIHEFIKKAKESEENNARID